VVPAFEDPAEWILEGNLPENVTPENSKLKDPEERNRIARVFERGLTAPSGYVLPIQRWQARASGTWYSEKWKLRRCTCSWRRATALSASGCRWGLCPTYRRQPSLYPPG
jgi:uncharacterized protein (DUF2126 family)